MDLSRTANLAPRLPRRRPAVAFIALIAGLLLLGPSRDVAGSQDGSTAVTSPRQRHTTRRRPMAQSYQPATLTRSTAGGHPP